MSALPRIIAYEHALCLGKGWKNHEEIPIYPSPYNFFTALSPNREHVHRLPNKRPPLSQNIR